MKGSGLDLCIRTGEGVFILTERLVSRLRLRHGEPGEGMGCVISIIHSVRCSHQSHHPGNIPCGRDLLTVYQFGWILSSENDQCFSTFVYFGSVPYFSLYIYFVTATHKWPFLLNVYLHKLE